MVCLDRAGGKEAQKSATQVARMGALGRLEANSDQSQSQAVSLGVNKENTSTICKGEKRD